MWSQASVAEPLTVDEVDGSVDGREEPVADRYEWVEKTPGPGPSAEKLALPDHQAVLVPQPSSAELFRGDRAHPSKHDVGSLGLVIPAKPPSAVVPVLAVPSGLVEWARLVTGGANAETALGGLGPEVVAHRNAGEETHSAVILLDCVCWQLLRASAKRTGPSQCRTECR